MVGMRETGVELADAICAAGGSAIFIQGDARDEMFMHSVAYRTIAEFGRIDGLVVGAAVAPAIDDLDTMTLDHAQETFVDNFGPAINSVRAVIPHMVRRKSGSIVFIGSINSDAAQYGQARYAISKSTLVPYRRQLNVRHAQEGIRVNMVICGTTPNLEALSWLTRLDEHPDMLKALAARLPRRCLTTPHEVAAAILFFLSPASIASVGNELYLDGGERESGGDLNGGNWRWEAVQRWQRDPANHSVDHQPPDGKTNSNVA